MEDRTQEKLAAAGYPAIDVEALDHFANLPQPSTPTLDPGRYRDIATYLGDPDADPTTNWLTAAGYQGVSLNRLAEVCHGLSYAAGWWHDPKTGEPTGTVPEKIALIHSEISEALEADRKSLMDDHLPDRPGIEVELADAVIRICDLAGALNLDLGGAVAAKLAYNQQRADHKREARAAGGKAY